MKTNSLLRSCPLAFGLAALLLPATRAAEPANLAVGALTLEASPTARFFAFSVPAPAVADLRADATGHSAPGRRQDLFDRDLSDSFPRHDPMRETAVSLETVPATLPSSAWAVTPASFDGSVPVVAPVAAFAPSPAHGRFADDMLAAPARTGLAREAAAAWLAEPAAPTRAALPREQPAAFVPTATGASVFGRTADRFARRDVSPAAVSPQAGPTPAPSPTAVYAWGQDTYGELGDGTTVPQRNSPTPVIGLGSGITAVVGGADQSLAVQNGAAYAWGRNIDGQLGNGNTTNSSTPVAVSGLTSGVTAVAAGSEFSLAIKGGAAYAWGYGGGGELGNNAAASSSVPVAVSGLGSGVTAIAAGNDHSLAVQNGAAYAWGNDEYGQLGNGTTSGTASAIPVAVSGLTSGVTAVAAGFRFSMALKGGAVYAWGNNTSGQLGNGNTTENPTPAAVLSLSTGVTAVAAGGEFGLALKGGAVYAWGNNGDGQLGNGTNNNASTPFQVDPTDLKNILAIGASGGSSYALASDGSLWVWGDNTYGELGLGDTSERDTPTHLLPPSGFRFSSLGENDQGFFEDAILTSTVPEPATWAGGALLLGAAGLALHPRRRRAVLPG